MSEYPGPYLFGKVLNQIFDQSHQTVIKGVAFTEVRQIQPTFLLMITYISVFAHLNS